VLTARLSFIFLTLLGAIVGALCGAVVGRTLATFKPGDDLALLVLWATVPIGAGVGTLIAVIGARRYLHD
jgi:ABC-type antimicrobial peptide transport system permease subunit